MATINKKGYSMTDLAGNKKVNKWSYVMAFIIIYLTDSLFFATNGMREIIAVKRIGVVVIAGLMLLRAETIKKQKYDLIMFFLSCSVLASMALARNVAQGYSYYTMVASLWFGYLYCREYSLEQFSHCYCNIMRIIAVVSLIGWLFASEIISIGAIPTITNTVGVRYKMLFFTCIPTSMSLIGRNMGPFWEPGAYQIYLNVALFFSLFIQKNRFRILDCILFIIACITTKSGAALAPIALLLAAYTFEKKHIKSFFAVFLLSVLIVVLFNTGMFNDITEKMAGDAETNSITYRWIGIEGAISLRSLVSWILIYSISALGLNIICGCLGEFVLGHGGFLLVGYTAAVLIEQFLNNTLGTSFFKEYVYTLQGQQLYLLGYVFSFFDVIVAGLITGLIGFLVGTFALRRLKGDYLAIVTLGIGLVFVNIAKNFTINGKTIFGGSQGIGMTSFIGGTPLLYALFLVLTLFLILTFMRSRFGRSILACRDDNIAAEACGVHVNKTKVLAFTFATFITGMAGALMAHHVTDLPVTFGQDRSILFLIVIVLGGLGSLTGSILASAVIVLRVIQKSYMVSY